MCVLATSLHANNINQNHQEINLIKNDENLENKNQEKNVDKIVDKINENKLEYLI